MKKEKYKYIPLFGLNTLAKRLNIGNAYAKLQYLFMGETLYIDKAFVDEVIKELEREHKATIAYLKQFKKENL